LDRKSHPDSKTGVKIENQAKNDQFMDPQSEKVKEFDPIVSSYQSKLATFIFTISS